MSALRAGEVTLEGADTASALAEPAGRSLRRLWRLKWGLVAAVVMLALIIVAVNLVVDLLVGVIDPRIRVSG